MNLKMKEWESRFIPDMEFKSKEQKEIAAILTDNGIMEMVELKNGVLLTTNSHVGRISIGDLDIEVTPKIHGLELFTLLNYAYSLNQLKQFDQTTFRLQSFSFFELLIYQLYLETEDLFVKGFQRWYVKKEDDLSTLRGRLDVNKLARSIPLQKTTLPSSYYERDVDFLLNQVLLAGLNISCNYVQDSKLKIQLQRLCTYLSEYISKVVLTEPLLRKAKLSINRLTERYRPIIEIVTLLYKAQGVEFKDSGSEIKLNGFFFDMNSFFEALLEKLIIQFAPDYSLKEQFQLYEMFSYEAHFNPKRRRPPTPRPDYALMKNHKVVKLMDAKYRDLWENSLPRDMLYQLTIYALSREGDKTATIIYPSQNEHATTQKIAINDPSTNKQVATVILKAINLNKVAMYIRDLFTHKRELVRYMDKVLFKE